MIKKFFLLSAIGLVSIFGSASADLVVDTATDTSTYEVVVDTSNELAKTGIFEKFVQFVIPSADASNGLVDMVGNTASGSISTAGEVMNSPMGYIIYFIIGLALVGLAVGTVLYWSNKG